MGMLKCRIYRIKGKRSRKGPSYTILADDTTAFQSDGFKGQGHRSQGHKVKATEKLTNISTTLLRFYGVCSCFFYRNSVICDKFQFLTFQSCQPHVYVAENEFHWT